jgi:P4 family phage/plasmid primase-like protien
MNSKLISFITNYEVDKDEPFTHTSTHFDTKKAKYFIPRSKLNEFFELYNEYVFKHKKECYLTEKHPNQYSKICIDFDFKYSEKPKEREINDDVIRTIVEKYNEIIQESVECDKAQIKAYVFLRPDGYEKSETEYKDGIHIMYPFLYVDYKTQQFIRNKVIEAFKDENLIDDMSCIPDLDSIIDESVIQRNNWYLYGSTKKGIPAYELTHIFDIDLDEIEIPENTLSLIKTLSILDQRDLNKSKIENEISKNKLQNKLDEMKIFQDISSNTIQANKNMETNKNFIIDLLKILKQERCDYYNDWFTIGCAIANENKGWFDIWNEWSKNSSKYNENACDKYWNTFANYDGERKLSIATIRKFARIDNEQLYLEILDKYNMKDQLYELLKQGLTITHYDLAMIIFYLYKDEFVFSNNEWYYFYNHKWNAMKENPIELKKKISNEIIHHYLAYNAYFNNKAYKASLNDNEKERDTYMNLINMGNKVIMKLKNNNMKNCIVKECEELFYNKDFADKLDTNIYLMAFNNGVLDLKSGQFRDGMATDMISYTTGYDYTTDVNDDIRDEIMKTLQLIQPNKEVFEFLLLYFASTLVATNKNELFINLEGSGGNGKGFVSTLHTAALGDYAGTLNNNYLVNTFSNPESHNTMLANNYKKRYLQVNEPPNTKQLNINLIKELTGGDNIQLRVAHSKDTLTVQPLFKLCMLFNHLPKIENCKDGGFLRRFIGIHFPNNFVENPKKLNEFKKDPKFKEKIKTIEWKQQYMLIILDYLKQYIAQNEEIVVPACIIKNSNQLLNEQDPIADFIESQIIVTDNSETYCKRSDLWEEYKRFFRENYPEKLKINAKQFGEALIKSLPDSVEYKIRYVVKKNGTEKKIVSNIFVGIKINYDVECYSTLVDN